MAFKIIDIHKRRNLDERKDAIEQHFSSKSDYKDFKEFLRLLSIGELSRKPVSERRQLKLLDMITIFLKNCDTKLEDLDLEDFRKFKERFLKDKILKQDGNPYSDETKEDCTETILRFYDWKFPENSAKFKLKNWFVIKASQKTPEILTEAEIEKLYMSCKNNAEKYLIAVLFDGGFRASEFFNLRFEDFIEPSNDFPYYRIDLKKEYSKTEGRNVGMYWKHSTEAIKNFLAELDHTDKKKPVFDFAYNNSRGFLRRLGERALNRNVHFHLFRKSSATFYASRLKNRQLLCVRYGWEFSSDMPDQYIKRSGVEEEGLKETMLNNDLDKLRKENEQLKTNLGIMSEKLNNNTQDVSEIKAFWEKIESNPKFKQLLENPKKRAS